jgi:hypothetical protein
MGNLIHAFFFMLESREMIDHLADVSQPRQGVGGTGTVGLVDGKG